MKLPKLYSKTSIGQIQEWEIEVIDNCFITHEGIKDGKITSSKPTFCKGKNLGRANETSPEDQALKEAKSKWTKKVESGYFEDIDKAGEGPSYYECQLAHKFEDYKDKLIYPVFVNRKYDGIRCIMTKNVALTRNGKEHKCVPHIQKQLESFFKKYPNAVIDGEIYSHELHDDFNKIASLVRKTKPTPADIKEAEQIVEYHVYDCARIGNLTEKSKYSDRFNALRKEIEGLKYIHIVEPYIAKCENDIKKYHEQFVSEGYEGVIVRVDSCYENKRSKNLLKYKTFEDAEFTILDIREGKGNLAGAAAHADFKTKEGKDFTANIKGTTDYKKELLKNKKIIIGKLGTVKYFNLTPDGIPRFPYLIGIRDYE